MVDEMLLKWSKLYCLPLWVWNLDLLENVPFISADTVACLFLTSSLSEETSKKKTPEKEISVRKKDFHFLKIKIFE